VQFNQDQNFKEQILTVQSLIRQKQIAETELHYMADKLAMVLEEIRKLPTEFDTKVQQIANEFATIHDSNYRQSGFLEVTIPIIPSILATKYEAEFDTTSNIPELIKAIRELWERWNQ
jgi:hypothetical protein